MRTTLVAAALSLWAGIAVAQPPSIVVIMLDDATPAEIDAAMPKAKAAIADQGRIFDEYVVNLSLCSPSRSTFLTGMYAHNHHVVCNLGPTGGFGAFKSLGHEQQTIALQLQRAGYKTALFGKYLNGYGSSYVPPGWTRWLVEQGGTCDQGYDYRLTDQGTTLSFKPDDNIHCDDYLGEHVSGWIKSQTSPFFVFYAASAPHPPNVPAHRYEDAFPNAKAPRTPDFNEADVSDKPPFIRQTLLTDDTIADRDAIYRKELQAIASVDDGVQKVMNALEASGKLSETYVFLTSDNGEWAGNHRLFRGKTLGFESDNHLTLWARGPGVVEGHDNSLVTNADFYPTINVLTGTPIPSWVDGRSFHRLLRDADPSGGWRNSLPLERYRVSPQDGFPDFIGVRTDHYAYWKWSTGQSELYDLVDDPFELDNQASNPFFATVKTQLQAQSQALNACQGQECQIVERNPVP
jgi:N-acetylglucosamine-6-sulfatase